MPHTILLDRDGTLIEECHYLRDPKQVALIPGSSAPWRRLAGLGCRFFLISNQSGIGRSLLTLDDYNAVQARLMDLLAAAHCSLQDAVFCPHTPEENCACRKPRIGLWQELVRRHALHAEECVMIGDNIADIHFGQNMGCAQTVLVLTGHGRDTARKLGLSPTDAPLAPGAPTAGQPTWVAQNLGVYLEYLAHSKDTAHAHRI